ncbi:coiled-coil domain-containing protein 12 [Coccinella septempunctata]|uniref:coiled-coil domain-containing protein 12 n=1 Tax=Coccinella septempunctata TaxID=41139 RepID=UPI001D08C31F|nr:coiled-coil domain-containing protein 12 [Coccinella septempunctata]
MEIEGEISQLEKQALTRKERLNQLKRKHKPDDESNNKTDYSLPKPKFRSYKPEHEELSKHKLPDAKPEDLTEEVKTQLESAKESIIIDNLDLSTLAPRKQDWDLKRDLAKELEILEKRTQKSIAELIRDELKKRQNLADVANMDMPGSKLVTS